MAQYDMTAWVKNGTDEAIGIVSSDVDMGLTALQMQLVAEYIDLPSVVYKFVAHAGSDQYVPSVSLPSRGAHTSPLSMSWHAQGYPSSFLTEGMFKNMDPWVHTPNESVHIVAQW
jgi:leucyl aminopeptidase